MGGWRWWGGWVGGWVGNTPVHYRMRQFIIRPPLESGLGKATPQAKLQRLMVPSVAPRVWPGEGNPPGAASAPRPSQIVFILVTLVTFLVFFLLWTFLIILKRMYFPGKMKLFGSLLRKERVCFSCYPWYSWSPWSSWYP